MGQLSLGEALDQLVPRRSRQGVDRVRTEPPGSGTLHGRLREVLLQQEEKSGLSRVEFGKRLGFKARQSYYNILDGTVKVTLPQVSELAERLNLNVYELLGVPPSVVRSTPELASAGPANAPRSSRKVKAA